jgi:hypothetical protein
MLSRRGLFGLLAAAPIAAPAAVKAMRLRGGGSTFRPTI